MEGIWRSLPPPDTIPIPERTLPVKTLPIALNASVDETAVTNPVQAAVATQPPAVPATMARSEASKSAEVVTEKRLEAALKFLHDRGQFNIILLGNGIGAIRAQQFLEKITPQVANPKLKAKLEKPVRAMVIINGRNALPTAEDAFDDWFNDPEVPVLDIFVDTDDRNRSAAGLRKTLARQKGVIAYKQVRLAELAAENSWGENRLSRRVRSFLDSNAVGIEVKNARLRRD